MRKGPRRLRIAVAAIVLALAVLAFLARAPVFPQAGTALLMAAATGVGSALVVAFGFLLLTYLFGRFYCAALCPLGILQDLIGRAVRPKGVPRENLKVLRYLLLAVTAGFLVAGWALPAKGLEPFSMFGRIVGGFLLPVAAKAAGVAGLSAPSANGTVGVRGVVVGALALLVLAGLVAWKKRMYCTAICPVGTLLGLFAKYGLLRLRLETSACVRCGQCAPVCPAGCIDLEAGTLDNERCLRCMNCVAACPKHSIVWQRALPGRFTVFPAPVGAEAGPSRRRFLAGMAGTVLVSSGLAKVLKPGGIAERTARPAIYPPGAGSAERFASKCTACLLCVSVCPGNVLRPPTRDIPFVHLDYEQGMCEFNCRECLVRCPTGAIRRRPLDQKKRCRIGMAVFHSSRCIAVVDGTHCGACAEHCPTGALRMVQHEADPCPIPVLEASLCIGCGNCSYPCPVRPERAITVAPVPIQIEAADPNAYFTSPSPPPASATDDWLL